MKQAAGKVFGDKKMETQGSADKAKGKLQNAVGGLKDSVRGNNAITIKYRRRRLTMELILIIVVLVLLFGGGGYWGRSRGHW